MTRPLSGVHLTGWGAYAPSLVLTNADLERMVETNDEWIVSRTGIRQRRIAGPDESTSSMAAVAGLRAIATAGLQPDDIDLIIVGTLTPDYPMPSTAALVKDAIGNKRAAAMDVGAACSGFVYGYATAHAYVSSGMARHVLVIGAETLSRCTDFTDRSTCILFGDGAGAAVLSASDEPGGTLGIEMRTEPSGAYLIWLPAGGATRPASESTLAAHEHFMKMKGTETFKMAVRTLGSTATASLAKAGLGLNDVDLVIPHQANIRIIEALAKSLDFPMERVFVNVDRYGNTSAASVPLALAEAVAAGRVKKGNRLLLVAFGAGVTSGAITLEWTADPAAAARAATIGPESVSVMPGYLKPVNPFPPALKWMLEDPTAGNGRSPETNTQRTQTVAEALNNAARSE
ncbi:MAG: beta-ketoacyl-ACP synthase III [Candidatus Limnocylindrales bacterium]